MLVGLAAGRDIMSTARLCDSCEGEADAAPALHRAVTAGNAEMTDLNKSQNPVCANLVRKRAAVICSIMPFRLHSQEPPGPCPRVGDYSGGRRKKFGRVPKPTKGIPLVTIQ